MHSALLEVSVEVLKDCMAQGDALAELSKTEDKMR